MLDTKRFYWWVSVHRVSNGSRNPQTLSLASSYHKEERASSKRRDCVDLPIFLSLPGGKADDRHHSDFPCRRQNPLESPESTESAAEVVLSDAITDEGLAEPGIKDELAGSGGERRIFARRWNSGAEASMTALVELYDEDRNRQKRRRRISLDAKEPPPLFQAERRGKRIGMKSLKLSNAPSSSSSSSSSSSYFSSSSSSSSLSSSSSSSSLAALPSSSQPLSSSPASLSAWIHLRSLLVVASAPVPDRGSLKSPWSRRKRKHELSHRYWQTLFAADGKFYDGGIKFLKKVRRGGVDPNIRAEVWPFLLGVYDLKSSDAERTATKAHKREEYEKLRAKCKQLLVDADSLCGLSSRIDHDNIFSFDGGFESHNYEDGECFSCSFNTKGSLYNGESFELVNNRLSALHVSRVEDEGNKSRTTSESYLVESSASNIFDLKESEDEADYKNGVTDVNPSALDTETSDSESSVEDDSARNLLSPIAEDETETQPKPFKASPHGWEFSASNPTYESFSNWQRIIRLDAIRLNFDWVLCSPNQAAVSMEKALQSAVLVGLKDYEHLEAYMIYHSARLVAILEAYAIYDPETGYCQGMSDLLSPILSIMDEDYEAFWCFVGFMKKARYNFRLDEAGIRRQLNIVSKIIKCKDSHLYRHLQKLQAEDCFFVYRMVVVVLRRELTLEQTMYLWEVIWADQAAIRAGIRKSAWGRTSVKAPPNDDLLLYAIAACILQRRKQIIDKYSSIDEIVRECNDMMGHLDVWKLVDDAHDLIVALHEKI